MEEKITPVKVAATSTQTAGRFIYYILGVLEVLLVFRLIFKLAGASHGSAFVAFIYSASAIFIWPFSGIFRSATATGVETTAIFEPSTLVAIIVYAIVAWGLVSLVRVLSGEREPD